MLADDDDDDVDVRAMMYRSFQTDQMPFDLSLLQQLAADCYHIQQVSLHTLSALVTTR